MENHPEKSFNFVRGTKIPDPYEIFTSASLMNGATSLDNFVSTAHGKLSIMGLVPDEFIF